MRLLLRRLTYTRPFTQTHRLYTTSTKANHAEAFSQQSDNEPSTVKQLYDTHIPVNCRQRGLLTLGSAFTAFFDPYRGDMVAALGETTGKKALEHMRKQMLQSESGRRILRERPVIHTSTIDFDKLRKTCAPGTFGHTYVSWLDSQGVTPDTRAPVHFVDNEELAYVMQRYRQSHDFFHTLTGLGVTVEEELALKWFEWAQTALPMTMLSSLFGPFMLPSDARRRLYGTYIPWAIQCGRSSVPLMSVYFEEHFYTPLDDLRRQLRITLPPTPGRS
ncbi:ubiquinone biosynthesis protein Coq4 [Syncephalastrum racemosum]|uniref:4-hydroxy-3-methoxy-5-polyprenylbenzoate decarboxylase n=1 Tax=Syncephalastrum racemosum TaxID=13706 RepID=A0A1X2HLY8_SYNRA|nr:ubiquinone biosynthesis protein Coq4 [Syncephalastrum racemosum]